MDPSRSIAFFRTLAPGNGLWKECMTETARYVELHARSAFSFLEGGSLPEALAQVCALENIPAMALLDRNGVYGSPRFHMAAKKVGIKAHVGAEIDIHDENGKSNFPLLCESEQGYQNLCRLLTKTKLRVPKYSPSSAQFEELEEYAAGLVCLTGDEHGPLAAALLRGGKDAARKALIQLVSTFGQRNVYVELQRHFDRAQEARNQAAVELAREMRLPVLATNGVCYATPAEREVLDVFTCIKHKRQLATAGRLLQKNAERHIRRPEEMARIFADLPDAVGNTHELSLRLAFTLEKLGYKFPQYPVPDGGSEIEYLRAQVHKGALDRYRHLSGKVSSQLKKELD